MNKDIEVLYHFDKLEPDVEQMNAHYQSFSGWTELPLVENLGQIKAMAEKIRSRCDVLVILGIGGSYLGTRAALDYIDRDDKNFPQVRYAGHNLSGTYHKELIEELVDKEICLCAVSKSGNSLEVVTAYKLFKEQMLKKYGNRAYKQIFIISGENDGYLRSEADKIACDYLIVPEDVGGRYSVLSSVGLLPMAVAGIDIDELLRGARASKSAKGQQRAMTLAVNRYHLLKSGKNLDIIETYEPALKYFSEWLKQLYGESEGKEGSGLFPTNLNFSTDLHSVGQYLQDGKQMFMETMVDIKNIQKDIANMNKMNKIVKESVIKAHVSTDIPIVEVNICDRSPYSFGNAVFFFELVSAFTASLMGVNPFDQPGVEKYKSEINKSLQFEIVT